MLNTMLSIKYKLINETDNFCSPRGTQNLVVTKQSEYFKKERGKLIHLLLTKIFQWLLFVLNQTIIYHIL